VLSNTTKTGGDKSSQEVYNPTDNQGLTTSKAEDDSTANGPAKVPTADSTNTIDVRNSNKLNNKLSNKPTQQDTDLVEIVAVWPELPEHIKAAIMALIRTA
jgi:hypothetical protein